VLAGPRVASRYVPVEAGLLHVLDHGGPDAPTVVLVHGVTGSAATWHGVAPALSERAHVVAVDLRGHGDSTWLTDGAYTSRGHATDVVAVLEALGVAPAVLVGSSWGALVALAVADARPDLVAGLVLVDIEPSSTQSETAVPPRPRRFDDLAAATSAVRTANPHGPDALVALFAAASTAPGPDGGRVPRHDPVFFERWPFRAEDWWPVLGTITAPTTVVHAGASWVRRDVTEAMAVAIAGAEHVELDDTAHVVPLDRPDALVEVLRAALTRAGG
jgi:pimeloyl-ACP methyl ester carboxylesterase